MKDRGTRGTEELTEPISSSGRLPSVEGKKATSE